VKLSQCILKCYAGSYQKVDIDLTLILLIWRICRAPNNVSKWQMGFNSAFKRLNDVGRPNVMFSVMTSCSLIEGCLIFK
jgi:hypothetical protein